MLTLIYKLCNMQNKLFAKVLQTMCPSELKKTRQEENVQKGTFSVILRALNRDLSSHSLEFIEKRNQQKLFLCQRKYQYVHVLINIFGHL